MSLVFFAQRVFFHPTSFTYLLTGFFCTPSGSRRERDAVEWLTAGAQSRTNCAPVSRWQTRSHRHSETACTVACVCLQSVEREIKEPELDLSNGGGRYEICLVTLLCSSATRYVRGRCSQVAIERKPQRYYERLTFHFSPGCLLLNKINPAVFP